VLTCDVVKFLDCYHGVEFVWGVNDCATFIASYLLDATGEDYSVLAPFNWKTKAQAVRFVKEGGKGVSEILDAVPHSTIASLQLAKTGDIVVLSQNGWDTAGVLISNKVAWFTEKSGLKISPIVPEDFNNVTKILRVY